MIEYILNWALYTKQHSHPMSLSLSHSSSLFFMILTMYCTISIVLICLPQVISEKIDKLHEELFVNYIDSWKHCFISKQKKDLKSNQVDNNQV